MHKLISRASLILVFLIALLTTAHGQQTGSIVGTVTDSSGAVFPHAKVMLNSSATKDVRSVTTNSKGIFAFSGVVAGDYTR